MTPNLAFVTDAFNRFNATIFSSQLPTPRFRLTHARTFRGKLVYRWKRTLLGKKCYDFEMRISLDFDSPQADWEDVVIHEMIHLLIASKGINDSSAHGPAFRKIMADINSRHGRHIAVSSRTTKEEADADKRVRGHYLCLAKFSDGRLGVAPVAKTKIFQLWDAFEASPDIVAVKWVGTVDPWFNRFRRVMSPKLYFTTPEEVAPHLVGALTLERNGNAIRAVNRRCSPAELLP